MKAARWVLNDYDRFSSVSSMLNQSSWPTLQSRLRLHSYIAQSILLLIISVNSSVLFIHLAQVLIQELFYSI